MKGKFYESEYEKALIDLLQAEGWQYTNGGNIHRQLREPLLIEDPKVNDLRVYLQNQYPDLADSDMSPRLSTICVTFPGKATLNVCATPFSSFATATVIPVMAMV